MVLGLASILMSCLAAITLTGDPAPPAAADVGKSASYSFNFDDNPVGKLPVSWVIRHTGAPTSPALWEVKADPSAPSKPNVFSLVHSDSEEKIFNINILYKPVPNDVDISVKLKAVSGKEDQGGGVIWRCTDENNYYICRVNPLEKNFRLYKIENGKRTQLAHAEVAAEKDKWYTLRAVMIGSQITCHLDGQKLLEAADETFKTGRFVGLWTKADASTAFDDLVIKPAEKK